jgi:hypothetical protein
MKQRWLPESDYPDAEQPPEEADSTDGGQSGVPEPASVLPGAHRRPYTNALDAETRTPRHGERLDRAYLRDAAPLLGVAELLERTLD